MNKNIFLFLVLPLIFGAGCAAEDQITADQKTEPAQTAVQKTSMDERDEAYVLSVFQEQFPEFENPIRIRITTSTPTHGRGFVDLGDGKEQLFFTMKIQIGWDVIFVKRPDYACDLVDGYDFPEQMIEDCKVGLSIADAQAIQKALADKRNKTIDETNIRITGQAQNFARGTVSFSMSGTDLMGGGGGLFLAAKIDGVWEIVFDGNGSYACNSVESYDFPQEMIEDCARE